MGRKILFVLFSDDACKQNHALMWGLSLKKSGIQVRILIEGAATRLFRKLRDPDMKTASLFMQAKEEGLIVGACHTASNGCANRDMDGDVKISEMAVRHGIQLDGDLDGHAGIAKHLMEGYELVVI